jgi:Peptidase family M28
MKKISFLLILALVLNSCSRDSKKEQGQQSQLSESQNNIKFPTVPVPQFDGKSAFAYLVRQVDFGPRAPNTNAHEQCLLYLQQELNLYADSVEIQKFNVPGYDGAVLRLSNIIAHFNTKSRARILLTAHWDSRPRADQQPGGSVDKPIPGADDGGSGVAVLMEMARGFKKSPPPVGVDIILWDGEDYGREGDMNYYCLGSKYWAATKPFSYQPLFAVNLDMIGQKDLRIPREGYSVEYARDVVDLIWNTARDMGVNQFADSTMEPIYDDHLQLDNVGMKAVDLIDFNYKYWHTLQDTPDKCSPESLSAVGSVLLQVIYRSLATYPYLRYER